MTVVLKKCMIIFLSDTLLYWYNLNFLVVFFLSSQQASRLYRRYFYTLAPNKSEDKNYNFVINL